MSGAAAEERHRLAAALDIASEGSAPPDGVKILRGGRPPVLDRAGRFAAGTLLLAGALWWAAGAREAAAASPIDPAALILRAFAVAATARALVASAELALRLRVWAGARSSMMALSDAGLLLRMSGGESYVRRRDVIGVRAQGDHRRQAAERRWAPVYVVRRPGLGQKRPFLEIPPLFERTPEALAERLMRWRGPLPERLAEPPEPSRLPSELYDRAASGERMVGVTAIPHGRAWLASGPYTSLVLGLVVLDGFARLPSTVTLTPLLIAGIALALLVVPGLWLVRTHRGVAPRRGLALVLTPAELLLRTRGGTLRATWRALVRLRVTERLSWSVLSGFHPKRTLHIEREGDPEIRYDEAYLGAPVEVVLGLCEAYRRGLADGGPAGARRSPDSAGTGEPGLSPPPPAPPPPAPAPSD